MSVSDAKREKVQQVLARAKRGSKARRKKKAVLAKASRRVAIRRKAVVHEITANIVKRHSANVVVENLKLEAKTSSAKGTEETLVRM